MGVRINTNIEALNAQRNLSVTAGNFAKSVEKLSSGLRINRAGDDAAGLTISEKLRGQVKGLNQAVRNAQDGISMIQTAEGALNETHGILQRMRELAVQASSDTLTTADRTAIGTELTALNTEVDRIASSTQFNTKTLLTGSLSTTLAVGSELKNGTLLSASKVAVSTIDVTNATASTTYSLTASGTTVTLTNMTTNVSQAVSVSAMQATGSSSQKLNFSTLGVSINLAGFDAANGTAANIAADLALAANDTVVTGAGGGATLQIGANSGQTMGISISDAQSTGIGAAGGYASLSAAVTAFTGGPTQTIASNLMLSLDQAISDVSTNRSNLGAYQNRLEHTIANLQVSSENLSASESRIRDVDLASETVNFTKANILQQAGTSILAQANQAPQSVLQLLR